MCRRANRPAIAGDPFDLITRHPHIAQRPIVKLLERTYVPLQTLPGNHLPREPDTRARETTDADRNDAPDAPQVGVISIVRWMCI